MATQTASATCASCRYWDAKNDNKGNCRRRAPQAIVFKVDEDIQYETRFPLTAASDWCGEYEPRS